METCEIRLIYNKEGLSELVLLEDDGNFVPFNPPVIGVEADILYEDLMKHDEGVAL